jgi:MoxR-like ATPase
VRFFGKNFGAPVCVRFGKILGKPGINPSAQRKLMEVTAASCDSHGRERLSTPLRAEFVVAFPDADATLPVSEEVKTRCMTCQSCSNRVRDTTVATELGWTAALCAAKGKLVPPTRFVHEARGCEYRRYGTPRSSVLGVQLLPEFDEAFRTSVDPIQAFIRGTSRDSVDPTEYPTDRPVEKADEAVGIRAWQKIPDPAGYGEDIFLPIYDLMKLPEPLRAIVPRTGDDEHPELYIDHQSLTYQLGVMWMHLDETPALWGEAGTGKTEAFRYMAWRMALPFNRFSITGSSELDDLAGKMMFTPGRGTFPHYGRIPLAWQQPGVMCVDEPNTGPPDVRQFFRPLTDNSKQLILDMLEGERLDRHADCYLGMAMNPSWDPRNMGTAELADADANRLMHVRVVLPPPEVERRIIQQRVHLDGWEMPDTMLDTVMSIAGNIRQLVENHTLPSMSWAIRQQIKVGRALRWFPPTLAYRRAIADSMEPERMEAILDQVRAQVEDDAPPWRS